MAIAVTVATVFWHVRLIAVGVSHATLARYFYLPSNGLAATIRRSWWSWAGCVADSKTLAVSLAWVDIRRAAVAKALAFFLNFLLAASNGA